MHIRKNLGLALSAAALLGAAATSQAALSPIFLDFDGPGTVAPDFAPAGLTIGFGQYVPFLDGFGDPILGSEHWELDLTVGDVPVSDPTTAGFGLAPSPSQALDARSGPVLMVFDTPFNLISFSTTLDNSTFGDLGASTDILFFDENNMLLKSLSVNQSIPGFVASIGEVGYVKTIVLPPTAFYDDIAAVPEPATSVFGLGLIAAAGFRRLRRS